MLAEESSEEEEIDSDLEEEIEGYAGKDADMMYDDEAGATVGDDPEQEEREQEIFRCDICNKNFKSIMQLRQHLASKNHRKAEQEITRRKKNSKGGSNKATALDEEDHLTKQLESLQMGENGNGDDSDDDVPYKKKKNDKKKKKKEKKLLQHKEFNDDGNSENEENGDTESAAHDVVFQLRGKEKQISSSSFVCRECSTGNTLTPSIGDFIRNLLNSMHFLASYLIQ